MLKVLFEKYNKIIGNKFFIKITVSFSLIAAVSILLGGTVVSNTVANLLIKKELNYEKQIIRQMNDYIHAKESAFKTIFSSIYNTNYAQNLDIINYLSTEETSETYDPLIKSNITIYLTALCNTDADITDIILYKNMNDSVSSSTKAERFVSYSYDFKNSGWFRKIKEAKAEISIIPTHNPEYIIHSNKNVITYAKNIYDNMHFSASEDIGTVMVNFNVANFKNALNGFDDLRGYVLVLDRNGFVIFDSAGKYTAKTYPYFSQLISGQESINLDEESIVCVNNDPSSKFITALVTPKDEVLKETTVIKTQIYLIIIFIIILSIILTILGARFFSKRVKRIMTSMKSVENGIFNNSIEVKGEDEIDQIAKNFNSMCYKLDNYINEVYVSSIKQKNAELNALQTQINPHFLFNTLESLRMKAVINNDNEVGDMAYNLSNIFKWVVKNKNTIITVEEELEYLQYYLALQKDRFGDRLEYILEIDEDILDFDIIKFILQPLIENAVQHGIEKKVEGGSITVKGYRIEDNLIFDIIDDGVGIDSETLNALSEELNSDLDSHPDGIGLKNVHDRIRIIYGDEYGIKIEKPEQGTIVKVIIPAKKHLG